MQLRLVQRVHDRVERRRVRGVHLEVAADEELASHVGQLVVSDDSRENGEASGV